mmetsp:Transcript_47554/g.90764  ORF Transcript_47554/g.90764 Transcript_47554/m.90764 type:complete len:336 (-) Transcript_47554:1931-2938(-)
MSSGCKMRANTSTPSTILGPGWLKQEVSTRYTCLFCTARSAHHPGWDARLATSGKLCSSLGFVNFTASISTSGEYANTCSQRRRTVPTPGSWDSSTPPARSIISGTQCPTVEKGADPERHSTRGRKGASATLATVPRIRSRSSSTSLVAAAGHPAAAPICTTLSRMSAKVRGRTIITVVPPMQWGPMSWASTSALRTRLGFSAGVLQLSWVITSPGRSRRNHSVSTSKLYRVPHTALSSSTGSPGAGSLVRVTTDAPRPLPRPEGSSQQSDTPVTRSPTPSAYRISVALGTREQMLAPGVLLALNVVRPSRITQNAGCSSLPGPASAGGEAPLVR